MDTIGPLIRQVIASRRSTQEAHDTLAALRQKWEVDNWHPIRNLHELQELLARDEDELRKAALGVYAETGEKQVAHGVAIRVNRRVIYHEEAAIAWSQAHGGIAHAFAPRIFERLALAGQATDIVKIEEVPVATLGKDLEGAR